MGSGWNPHTRIVGNTRSAGVYGSFPCGIDVYGFRNGAVPEPDSRVLPLQPSEARATAWRMGVRIVFAPFTPGFQRAEELLNHGIGSVRVESGVGMPTHKARWSQPDAFANRPPKRDDSLRIERSRDLCQLVDLRAGA